MKKLAIHKLLGVVSSLLMAVAVLNIKPMCAGAMYQPEVPKNLQK